MGWSGRITLPAPPRPPDGLLTPAEAAAKLRISTNTLNGLALTAVNFYEIQPALTCQLKNSL